MCGASKVINGDLFNLLQDHDFIQNCGVNLIIASLLWSDIIYSIYPYCSLVSISI